MKRFNTIFLFLFTLLFVNKLHSQGGDTPVQAAGNQTSFPINNVPGTTVGKADNVSGTTGLPTGFPATYISGNDYFYYFCPGVTVPKNITVTLNYTPTNIPTYVYPYDPQIVSPALLIWDGVPGNAGSTVVSSIYSSGDSKEVTGTLSTSFNAQNFSVETIRFLFRFLNNFYFQ